MPGGLSTLGLGRKCSTGYNCWQRPDSLWRDLVAGGWLAIGKVVVVVTVEGGGDRCVYVA
jgi:hypothetical protein